MFILKLAIFHSYSKNVGCPEGTHVAIVRLQGESTSGRRFGPQVFLCDGQKNTAAWDFLNLNDTLFLGGTFSLIDAAPRRQAGRMQSPPKPWNPHCTDLGRLTHVLIIFEEIYLCVLYSDPYIAAVYPTYYAIYVKYL